MGHLDTLHEELGPKGLSVIAITKQDRAAVDRFLEETSAKHPIVIESSDSMRSYGCNSYPSAFLIGPGGRILWNGHPGNLQDDQVKEALSQAQILPEFPDALKAARKSLDKEKYGDAQEKVRKELERGKLEDDEKAAAEKIDAWLTWFANSNLENAAKDAEAGNHYAAWHAYTEIADWYKGTAEGKRAEELADAMLDDDAMKDEIKAGDKLAKIKVRLRDASPKKALKLLAPMTGRKYRDTKAGQEAAKLIEALESEK